MRDWEPISELLDNSLGKRSGVLIAGKVPYYYTQMFKEIIVQMEFYRKVVSKNSIIGLFE